MTHLTRSALLPNLFHRLLELAHAFAATDHQHRRQRGVVAEAAAQRPAPRQALTERRAYGQPVLHYLAVLEPHHPAHVRVMCNTLFARLSSQGQLAQWKWHLWCLRESQRIAWYVDAALRCLCTPRTAWTEEAGNHAAHLARLAQNAVGTKHLVTRLLNHRLLHVVKSVTTVAKLTGSIWPFLMRRCNTRNGTCCMRGCTEMTRSGLYCSNLQKSSDMNWALNE